MKILSLGDKVGIVACSNGLDKSSEEKINKLAVTLRIMGINPVFSNLIYKKKSIFNGTGEERAIALMDFYKDKSVKAIFDISGGDLANGLLEYIDFNIIKDNPKPFIGYSDLSVIINSIYAKTNTTTYLYQIRNLVGSYKEKQIEDFKNTFINGEKDLFTFNYRWIQGNNIDGIVVGGNIRCLLKLAGTEFMPDFQDKILFLESLGGDVGKMSTFLTQYKNLGVFKKVKGIILGSYTEMERENYTPSIVEMLKEISNDEDIPIAKTEEIGHGQDSKCIAIGERIVLS